jgi:hypothetical protein
MKVYTANIKMRKETKFAKILPRST